MTAHVQRVHHSTPQAITGLGGRFVGGTNMPVTRTNTKRYIAICDVTDCDWSAGPHGLRIVVSQRLRHHLQDTHGLHVVEESQETRHMKTHKTDELPEQSQGPKLSDYAGQLIVFRAGWEVEAQNTKYGRRDAVKVDIFVYNTEDKAWDNPGQVLVFFATVQKQLEEAGNDDDYGAVLVQGTDRNAREWHLATPSAAQIKLLDKFDPSF